MADPKVHRGVACRKAPYLAGICWPLVNVNEMAHRPAVSGVERPPKATFQLRVTPPNPTTFPICADLLRRHRHAGTTPDHAPRGQAQEDSVGRGIESNRARRLGKYGIGSDLLIADRTAHAGGGRRQAPARAGIGLAQGQRQRQGYSTGIRRGGDGASGADIDRRRSKRMDAGAARYSQDAIARWGRADGDHIGRRCAGG